MDRPGMNFANNLRTSEATYDMSQLKWQKGEFERYQTLNHSTDPPKLEVEVNEPKPALVLQM